MVTSLFVRDFRGIHEAQVEGLARINVLVGPNNSGKTALLEAIYLASCLEFRCSADIDTQQFDALLAASDMLNDAPVARIWAKHLHVPSPAIAKLGMHPSGYIHQIDIKLAGKAPLKNLSLKMRDRGQREDWPDQAVMQLVYVGLDLHPPDAKEATLLKRLIPVARPFGSAPLRSVYLWDRPLTHHFIGHATWYLTGKVATAQNTFFYDAQKTLEHLPTEFYERMVQRVPGWTHKIAERMGRVLGIRDPFNVLFMPAGPERQWMQGQIAPPDRPALPIDDFGDGARAVFKVLAPLIALSEQVTDDEPGVFLWEEPELFQNPVTLGRLLFEVADLAKNKPLQVFIATHSLEVVAHLVSLVERAVLADADLNTLRTHLHQGTLTTSRFSAGEVRRWTAMQLDVRVPDGRSESPLAVTLQPPEGAKIGSGDDT